MLRLSRICVVQEHSRIVSSTSNAQTLLVRKEGRCCCTAGSSLPAMQKCFADRTVEVRRRWVVATAEAHLAQGLQQLIADDAARVSSGIPQLPWRAAFLPVQCQLLGSALQLRMFQDSRISTLNRLHNVIKFLHSYQSAHCTSLPRRVTCTLPLVAYDCTCDTQQM